MSALRDGQCDQIGLFLKRLNEKISCNNSPNILKRFRSFDISVTICIKSDVGTFWATMWLLFIPSSGHTGDGKISTLNLKLFLRIPSKRKRKKSLHTFTSAAYYAKMKEGL